MIVAVVEGYELTGLEARKLNRAVASSAAQVTRDYREAMAERIACGDRVMSYDDWQAELADARY